LFLLDFFKKRRRARVLRTARLDEQAWTMEVARYPFTRALNDDERARLRDLVILFLAEKPIHAARGLNMDEGVRLAIATQACMPILNLDLDWYRPWTEVIVYPGEFVARREEMDEDGVVHTYNEEMSGESSGAGVVALSWADAQMAGQGEEGRGYNVVIHEFAHQLDMLNGDANGFPPLHADMNRREWADAWGAAYAHFCKRVDEWEDTAIDEYASDSPAEFFAVLSEAFFETPGVVLKEYPAVYEQLTRFYRQDPAGRIAHKEANA
jgi:Mlc titration factor MtfA (ptsG expression regulator)